MFREQRNIAHTLSQYDNDHISKTLTTLKGDLTECSLA